MVLILRVTYEYRTT